MQSKALGVFCLKPWQLPHDLKFCSDTHYKFWTHLHDGGTKALTSFYLFKSGNSIVKLLHML